LLISVVADSLYIRLVFRATGGTADVVRAVDVTWKEAEELRRALTRTLYQHAERPAEKDSWRDLTDSKHECE